MALSSCLGWWAVLGSNQWPLPCEMGLRNVPRRRGRLRDPLSAAASQHPSNCVCALSRRPLPRFVARLLPYLERCGVAVTAVTARAPIANSLLVLMHRQRLIASAPARSRCRYRAGGECRQDCSRCCLNCRTTPDVRFRHRTTAPSSRRSQCHSAHHGS